jgi:hypothetical protein
VRIVTASDVNAFLREIAGVKISLKDFRTLCASAPRSKRSRTSSRLRASAGGGAR